MVLHWEGDFEITLGRTERDLTLLNQNFISQVQNIRLYVPHDALHILEESLNFIEHLKQLGDRADRKACCGITLEVALIGYDLRLRITKRGLQALKGLKLWLSLCPTAIVEYLCHNVFLWPRYLHSGLRWRGSWERACSK